MAPRVGLSVSKRLQWAGTKIRLGAALGIAQSVRCADTRTVDWIGNELKALVAWVQYIRKWGVKRAKIVAANVTWNYPPMNTDLFIVANREPSVKNYTSMNLKIKESSMCIWRHLTLWWIMLNRNAKTIDKGSSTWISMPVQARNVSCRMPTTWIRTINEAVCPYQACIKHLNLIAPASSPKLRPITTKNLKDLSTRPQLKTCSFTIQREPT